MKRIALAPLVLAAVTLRWLNGKPDPRAAHRAIIAVVAAVALVAILSPAPATADHGHNCVWSGGAWIGQGPCPGMPGFDDPHGEPTPTPTVTSAPTQIPTQEPTQTPAPSPTSTAPSPTSTAPAPTATTPAPTSTSSPQPTSTPAPTRTGCVRSYGNEWCTGATPSTSTTTPAPVVVGPLVETDIVLYAPEVNPARILR